MGKLNNISTIFFDAGGVLFDTKVSRGERIRRVLRARGFNDEVIEKGLLQGEEFSDAFFKSGKWLNNWKEEEIYWDNYYHAILNEVSKNYTYSLKKQLFYQTHYAIHCVLFDEVRALLENLHGKYKLGVISNAFPSMDWVFDSLDIRRYFDSITISAFAEVSKPDKEIYKFALNSLEVKPEECIFIDDKKKNVEAANEIGFIGIHLDRKVDNLRIVEGMLRDDINQDQMCV